MFDKLLYISNDDTQQYPFCRLKLVVETMTHSKVDKPKNQNSVKVSKVVKPTNKKHYCITLRTRMINKQPIMHSLSLLLDSCVRVRTRISSSCEKKQIDVKVIYLCVPTCQVKIVCIKLNILLQNIV